MPVQPSAGRTLTEEDGAGSLEHRQALPAQGGLAHGGDVAASAAEFGGAVLGTRATRAPSFSAGGLIVGLATLVAKSDKLVQVGDSRDIWRNVAVVLAVLGVGVLTRVTWFNPLVAGLLSAASLIAAFRLRRAGPGLTVGLRAFVAAWPLGFGLFVLLDAMKLGRIDEYGDYPWAGGIGVAVWCGPFAVGLATYAKGLRSVGAMV